MTTLIDNVAGKSDSLGLSDWVISATDGQYRDPRTALADGVTYAYKAIFADGTTSGFETGQGVWSTGTSTLTRATVKTSTSGDATKHSFASGTKLVLIVADTQMLGDLGGSGDMLAATYDPLNTPGDVFDMGNMVEATDANILTDAERTKLAGVDTGATDDQTGAEIKVAYEGEANTNAYTDAEKTKLAGIDTGATDDQTGAEIKVAYEGEANTNAYTDAEKTKLAGVDTGATDDQTGAEIKAAYEAEADTNAFTDTEKTKLAGLESSKFLGTYLTLGALQTAHPSPVEGSYAHVDAGVGTEVAVYIWDNDDTSYHEQAGASSAETAASIKTKYESNADTNAFTDTEQTKLAGIDTGATDDQTGAEIKVAYEAEADTNAFTDAEKTKLTGIDTGATDDQTGAEIKVAYEAEADTNAYTDTEKTKLAGIDTGATDDQTGAEIKVAYEAEADTNAFTDADHSKLDGIEDNADVTDAANVATAGALMSTQNLFDLDNTTTARDNLGVEIGVDVQAYNATLADLASGGGWTSSQTTTGITNHPFAVVFDEPTTNLCTNPKFESDLTGWATVGTSSPTRVTSQQWIGAASCQMSTNAAGEGIEMTGISVDINSTYVLSCYAKVASGVGNLRLEIEGSSSGATNSGGYFSLAINDVVHDEWRRFRWWINTDGTDATAIIRVLSDNATSQTIYIDAVQFEKRHDGSADADDANFPSTYCDGDMGEGHTWGGTANASSSSRSGGIHFLNDIADDSVGAFVVGADGSIQGRMRFNIDSRTFGAYNITDSTSDEPYFPIDFQGNMDTNVILTGMDAGLIRIKNSGSGVAAWIESGTTADYGFILSFPSITSGTGMAVFAPADLTTMISSGGQFFEFADKSGNKAHAWAPEYQRSGSKGWTLNMMHRILGGGGYTTTNTSNLTGTVSTTNNSPSVTGASTTFLTDYKPGSHIEFNDGGTWREHNVESVESDTALTLAENYTDGTDSGMAHRSHTTQYRPSSFLLESNHANHSLGNDALEAGATYITYPSGGSGQLRVIRNAVGAADPFAGPTDDGEGYGLATGVSSDTTQRSISASASETTVITGYTMPAYTLTENGAILRITFFGDFTPTAGTATLQWRVKVGGTTILTSNAQEAENTGVFDFRGVIEIVATGEQAQKASIMIQGKTATGTVANAYMVNEIGSSSVDMRIDRAITVTADFSTASSLNLETAYMELI